MKENKEIKDCSIEELLDCGKSIMMETFENGPPDYFGLKVFYDQFHTDEWIVSYTSHQHPDLIKKHNKDLREALIELLTEAWGKMLVMS